jgi:endonuclease YncB( thermonuclease family)
VWWGPRSLAATLFSGIALGSAGLAAEPKSATAAQSSQICRLETVATGTAVGVVDGRTFTLSDGREVRLDGIEIPPRTPLDASPDGSTPSADTANSPAASPAAALDALVVGHAVVLKHSKSATDRYGRILADAYVADATGADQNGAGSVAKTLVAQGFARVAARSDGPSACIAELRTAEHAARAAKLGLWADPRYFLIPAGDVGRLSAERGRFTLVEGTVVSVRESGATIYVNFGRRWSEDFTVTILKRNERLFTAAGMDPRKLTGRHVMVRGWVEERGGPWIEAAAPGQIELVAEK